MIKVENKKSKRAYSNFAGSVEDSSFFKNGTFQGIPYAEGTDKEGKFRVCFKHPENGKMVKTYSYTETHPLHFKKANVQQIKSDIEKYKTCYVFNNMRCYYKQKDASIMKLPDHIIKL